MGRKRGGRCGSLKREARDVELIWKTRRLGVDAELRRFPVKPASERKRGQRKLLGRAEIRRDSRRGWTVSSRSLGPLFSHQTSFRLPRFLTIECLGAPAEVCRVGGQPVRRLRSPVRPPLRRCDCRRLLSRDRDELRGVSGRNSW